MVLIEGAAGYALGAAIAMTAGAIGTAWAQASIGAAAMGAIAEKPENASKLIIWLALPETMVILGFVIALMLTLKIAG